ncbi:hypothetical protein QQ045_004534 [Rhodiola kirilowii]
MSKVSPLSCAIEIPYSYRFSSKQTNNRYPSQTPSPTVSNLPPANVPHGQIDTEEPNTNDDVPHDQIANDDELFADDDPFPADNENELPNEDESPMADTAGLDAPDDIKQLKPLKE